MVAMQPVDVAHTRKREKERKKVRKWLMLLHSITDGHLGGGGVPDVEERDADRPLELAFKCLRLGEEQAS
jgi:hypothetical protein